MEDVVEVKEISIDKGITLLEFELKRPITPSEAVEIVERFPRIEGRQLLLSGRGPIWLYCMLVHKYMHLNPIVAVYDPKLQGYVVVTSHTTEIREGEVIKIEKQ